MASGLSSIREKMEDAFILGICLTPRDDFFLDLSVQHRHRHEEEMPMDDDLMTRPNASYAMYSAYFMPFESFP